MLFVSIIKNPDTKGSGEKWKDFIGLSIIYNNYCCYHNNYIIDIDNTLLICQ